jgi:hypothetical protein
MKLPKKFADIEVTRVNNDINGNPRRVVHFLSFVTEEDDRAQHDLHHLYEVALKRSRKIGGRKFHNKQYGGGIVFESYDDNELRKDIAQLMAKEEACEPKQPERFELALQPEPHVWDTKRKQVVFTINAPYAQMICLERSDESGFSGLVQWMNALDEEALRSEGIE